MFPFKIKDKDFNEKLKDKDLNEKIYKYFYKVGEDDYKDSRNYNLSRYFYNNSKKAIIDFNDDIVQNYELKINKLLSKKFNVSIEEDNKEYEVDILKKNIYSIILNEEKKYDLEIDKIHLKIYKDTEVGVLIYYLNNYNYCNIEDIININECGRRIYPQYISEDKNCYLANVKNNFLANELRIQYNSNDSYVSIIENFEESFFEGKNIKEKYISKTVIDILKKFFDFENNKDLKIENIIEPIIDDRMFTLFYYRNFGLANELSISDNYKKSEIWNRLMYIDKGYCTIQNEEKLIEDNIKSTYKRWTKYKSFYGITRYSFLLLTQDNNESYLINHINDLYSNMCALCLVQRASLLKFSDDISEIAKDLKSSHYDNKVDKKIDKLHRDYIRFKNTVYFREVSAQEQGIEIYNKIQESFEIPKDIDRIGESINNLRELSKSYKSESLNSILYIIAIVGVFFGLDQMLMSDIQFSLLDNFKDYKSIGILELLFNKIKNIFQNEILSKTFIVILVPSLITLCSKFITKSRKILIIFLIVFILILKLL
jgi:hypothetical protein